MHGLLDGLHHFDSACLVVRPEYLIHVELAKGHAEVAVGGADAALPARLNLLLASHVLAVELEVLVHEHLGQHRGIAIQGPPAEIGLPVVERHRVELLVHSLEEIWIADVEAGELGRAVIGEILGEFEVRGHRNDLRRLHHVVALLGIAAFGAVHGNLRQPGLDRKHGLSFGGSVLRFIACQLEHLLHVLLILLPRLHRLGIVFDVVVAIRQRDSTLVEVRDGQTGIVHVGHGIETEQHRDAMAMHVGDLRNDLLLRLDGRDAAHLRLKRRGPLFLDRALVHARRIVVANLLLDGAMLPGRLCLVDEIAQNVEIVLV